MYGILKAILEFCTFRYLFENFLVLTIYIKYNPIWLYSNSYHIALFYFKKFLNNYQN